MILIKVLNVDFDFDSDDDKPDGYWSDYNERLLSETVGRVYELDDEDEICDAITDQTGMLVNEVQYEILEA